MVVSCFFNNGRQMNLGGPFFLVETERKDFGNIIGLETLGCEPRACYKTQVDMPLRSAPLCFTTTGSPT